MRAIPLRLRVGRRGVPYQPKLLRRFLRNRFADPTGFTERELEDWLDNHWEGRRVYEFEDYYCWNHWCRIYEDANPALAAKHFEIRQFLRCVRASKGKGLLQGLPVPMTPQAPQKSDEPWLPVEERLMLHLEGLFHHPQDSSVLRESFINSPFHLSDVDYIDRDEKSCDFRDMLAAFLPFWIRSPRTCPGRIDRARILAHVFGKHPEEMPKFAGAFDDCTWLDIKPFIWLILVAYQGSLQRASHAFGWRVPKRFQFALETIDPSRLPGVDVPTISLSKQATILAEVTRLGGNVVDARRLLWHPAYAIDPTDFLVDDAMMAFWAETVGWIAMHRHDMDDDVCDLILDWAVHEFTERRRQGDPRRTFRWKGRTVSAATQMAVRHFQQIAAKEHDNKTWPTRNLSWTCEMEAALWGIANGEQPQQVVTKWRFVELTSGKSLREEGEDLRHCVGRYWAYCMDGISSIVSLRRNGQRRLTVELRPANLEILQVRGPCNREATDQEMKAINRWHREWVTPHGLRWEPTERQKT